MKTICHERSITLCHSLHHRCNLLTGASVLEDFSICIWKGKQRQQTASVRKSTGSNILSEKRDKRTTFLKAAQRGRSNSKKNDAKSQLSASVSGASANSP